VCIQMYFLLTACFIGSVATVIGMPRVLYTPVFPFLPNIKQHHIIIVPGSHNSAYAFDFTPVNQNSIMTQLDLLFGKNVPGEIRILHIPDATGDLDTVESWETIKGKPRSRKISDGKIIKLIKRTESWNTNMNMYTHNCQHFSAFMHGLLS
jgi:hypothetical protein